MDGHPWYVSLHLLAAFNCSVWELWDNICLRPIWTVSYTHLSFSIGDRVTVIDTNGTEHGVYTGVIEDIDDESDDAVILSIAIYHQADDIDLPLTGRLVMAVNDTQTRVRSKVIRSMERCKLESKYMYHVFDDFSVDGYEEIQDDLKDYLVEKMASQYPPNQMQLEAIIKGILTEDLLLVLGCLLYTSRCV